MGCPSEAELGLLLKEELDTDQAKVFADHVETCSACRLTLAKLAEAEAAPLPQVPAQRSATADPFLLRLAHDSRPSLLRDAKRTITLFVKPDAIPGYQILEELGRGGMAVVYKARQPKLDRLVALKMILSGSHASIEEIARFRTEAETVARLRHPQVVQIYDIGEVDGWLYLSLEYVEGGSLGHHLREGTATTQQAARLVESLARTMQYCHERGVVHRDLKPANILLHADSHQHAVDNGSPLLQPAVHCLLPTCHPKITDFGLAKRLDISLGLTRTGVIAGTPSYMAPEQASGTSPIGPAVDIYALGVILYEMLSGRPPFEADTPVDTIMQLLHEEPVPLTRLRPNVPRDLETITMKCLQKEPGRRYAASQELAEDLHRFLSGEPIRAQPPSLIYRWVRYAKRHRGLVAGVAAAIVALVGGTLVSILFAIAESRSRHLADENAQQADIARQAAEREAYQGRLAAAQVALSGHELEEASRHLESAPEALRGWEWRHLESRLREESPTIIKTPAIYGGAWALPSNGKFGVTLNEGVIRLIEVNSGKLIHTFPRATTTGGAPTKTGYVALTQRSPEVWDLEDETGRVRSLHFTANGSLDCLGASPDVNRIAAVWQPTVGDFRLRFFDMQTGRECRPMWKGGGIRRLTFAPDGRTVAGACLDGKVRLWDFATDKVVELPAGDREIRCVAFNPSGTHVAAGGIDSLVREWDVATGRLLRTLRGHSGFVHDVAYSNDSRWLASGSDDSSVRIWSADRNEAQATLRTPDLKVTSVAFGPDSTTISAAARGEEVFVWRFSAQTDPHVLRGHGSYVYPVAFSPDGRWFASGSWNGTVQLWDASHWQPTGSISNLLGFVASLAVSPDGKHLAVRTGPGIVSVWEIASLRRLVEIKSAGVYPAFVNTIAFSPDGAVLVWGEGNGLRRWNWATERELPPFTPPVEGTRLVAYSPDGRHLAVAGSGPDIVVLDPGTGQVQCTLPGHEDMVRFLAFSPDGRRLISAAGDRLLRLWDATAFAGETHPKPLVVFKGHTQEIFAAALHPDGTRLASGGRDRAVHIWDVATGDELIRLPGHTNYVFSLAFSPDGRTLISGSGDYTVRVWESEAP
jgi:WD40 repeat protein/serine/threonine protein kinase